MQTIDFIHPEDAAALEALKKIPVLPKVTKAFMDLGAEQLQTGLNMASKVRLSPTQLPHLYHILPPICELLNIKEPDFYLEMNPCRKVSERVLTTKILRNTSIPDSFCTTHGVTKRGISLMFVQSVTHFSSALKQWFFGVNSYILFLCAI